MKRHAKRIPSLDGLRMISILFVLLGHIWGTRNAPAFAAYAYPLASFGVHIFFVISGYLITRLLLREHDLTGAISLRQFYIRRAFRIFPAAYIFIAVAFVLFHDSIAPLNAFTALTYTSNYDLSRPWQLGHLWSLAVEEQFYLLWPLLLSLMFSKRTTVLVATVIAVPFIDCVYYHFHMYASVGAHFPTVADALATGCLLSVWEPRLHAFDWLKRSSMLFIPGIVICLQLIPLAGRVGLLLNTFIILPATNVGIAATVYHVVRRPYRILNCAPVVWVGTLSYSLYLFQQPFLNRHSSSIFCAFPQNIALALLAAIACHYLIEKPFLSLRGRRRAQEAKCGMSGEWAGLPAEQTRSF